MSNYGFPEATQPGKKPIVNSVFDFSDAALGELRLWLEQNPPAIGISNILGFSQFTAQTSVTTAAESTTSSTFGNLATVGPTLSKLPNGSYVVIWGCRSKGNPGVANASMCVAVNGTSLGTTNSLVAATSVGNFTSVMVADTAKLTNAGNNTLQAKYASSDNVSTATFEDRFLIALRYSNT